MKKSDRGCETEADVLMRQAEEYASASLMGVLEGLAEDPEKPNQVYREYSQLLHGLEVHYLFPNLGEAERKVLEELLHLRTRLAVQRRRGGGVRSAEATVKEMGSWEKRLAELKMRAQSLEDSPNLTEIQRSVLKQLL